MTRVSFKGHDLTSQFWLSSVIHLQLHLFSIVFQSFFESSWIHKRSLYFMHLANKQFSVISVIESSFIVLKNGEVVTSKNKRVYLKTLSKKVGGWSRPFQNFFIELNFDNRCGAKPFCIYFYWFCEKFSCWVRFHLQKMIKICFLCYVFVKTQ